MKRIIRIAAIQLLIVVATGLGLVAQDFRIDAAGSSLRWEGKGVGKSHHGTISFSDGSLKIINGMPVSGDFVIDMTTIKDKDIESEAMAERLEGHLKSEDFFGVERFPQAKFVLKSAEKVDGGILHIMGDLTIKGKTNPVMFNTEYSLSGDVARFVGVIEVDRSLYDVRYGSGKFFENLGDRAINDIFTLEFELGMKSSDQ